MAEPERFQVGDQCYTGTEAAAQAFIARFEPVVLNMDHGEGHGVEPTMFKALFYEEGFYDPHNEISIDGGIVYEATGVTSGGQTHRTMAFAPPPCVNDAETSMRISDMSEVWTLFLVAIIVVFCLRKLFDIFDRSPHGEQS